MWAHGDQMNTLGDLLRTRKDELRRRGDTVRKIAERAGLAESVVYMHLAKRTPYRQTPYAETLDALAAGFQLDLDLVWEKAKESTGRPDSFEGNPLQHLLTVARDKRKLSNAEIERQARANGYTLSRATLTNLFNGKHVNVAPETVSALSLVLKIPKRQIEEASSQAAQRVSYRLPKRLEERLTPEKWDRIVQIVEGILTVDEQ